MRRRAGLDVAILEPSSTHYYQPLWTLVGGGIFPKERSAKPQAEVIPKGVHWIKDSVAKFDPENRRVETQTGNQIEYEYLVVAVGIQIFWNRIKGLAQSLGKDGVCSNYSYDSVEYTWQCIKHFRGGNALFTFPNTPVKCAGAPQKILYLAEDHFRRTGLRNQANLTFLSASPTIFAVKKYADSLTEIIRRREIEVAFKHNLVEVLPNTREAVFENLESGELVKRHYDLIHVTPPMGPPGVVSQSPLSDKAGWLDVDKHTLRHTRFSNVFALGDVTNCPTSRTGAAIRKQTPVLISNLLSSLDKKPLSGKYNGYSACPIVTGYGKLILAEFDYDGKPTETFPWDQSKERLSMYLFKKYMLPLFYWRGMMKGHA